MSISRNLFDRVVRIKSFLNRKMFKTLFISFSAFFLFLGVFNVYAQENLNLNPDWEGTKTFHNTISGTDADEDNMNSRQGQEALNTSWTAISILAPSLTENGAEAMANPNIPADLKGGVLGLVTDATTSAFASYPMVNVGQHLAQNWIPGYDESQSGIYAAKALSEYPSGYQSLVDAGITPLWTKMLNLSYVFFVIVMIAAGFMIMFRHKLGGQTMVTIGNVLPNVILALIVATFSFAIAGLIIDMGGILVYIIADILDGPQGNIGNLGALFQTTFTGGEGIPTFASKLLKFDIGKALIFGGITAVLGPISGGLGLIGILLVIGAVGAVIVGVVKVLITLYKAYFGLLINVMLGPIQITLGALPGNKHMITNWLLSILRNVLVFPVVFFLVNLPHSLTEGDSKMVMDFPNKLTYGGSIFEFDIQIGPLFIFIFKVFVLYFAAQAPKFLEAWLPANTPKAVGEGLGAAKASLSKIPLVGGLFK